MQTRRDALLLMVFLAALLPGAVSAQTFRLYLAPDGNDAAAGTSASTALRSLSAAQQRLLERRPTGAVDVVIAAGTYLRQSVQWTFTNGASIRFIAASDAATPPWFDGRGGATWFTLKGGGNAATRLTFTGLKVSNYWMAMDLGSSKRSQDGNSGNVIRNMTFERIGGIHGSSSEAAYSFAAIRLQNSRDNRIERSRFISIENDTKTSGFIHAIYLARHSSGNRIEGNTFTDVNGDAVRTRDASDNTYVSANRFVRAGKYAAFSDWIKPEGECPSQGGQFFDNTVGAGYYGAIDATRTTGADDACGALKKPRIEERGTLRGE
ncbi:right-handed parallel beta-helix repeat-containing protein [Xanthomonas hortorum]|uniref:right-handed parallel beta-helix repeat-containing protein n=1 Tax=Xanthomonas hortorum TaxID=56454 RepID=UPI001E4140D6|nr:right-handed parallel beta-helix repeat-containing protein [Xanthomonas hortorum]MCC8554361.1 right-handed parallel beta-helix repeat-containing protein [Xanthomonas hortorum pv. gardneri]MCE4362023.1 right-handed parallel beta-helix repeat-containing protein [Xanthomonas hortorum]